VKLQRHNAPCVIGATDPERGYQHVQGLLGAFNEVNPRVDDFDVNFLNAIGITVPRHIDHHITKRAQLTPTAARQSDDHHSQLLGFFCRLEDVCAVPACRDADQAIARFADSLNVPGEYVFKPVIISHARQMAGIAACNGRQSRAIIAVASAQFLRKMHGITHGTPIADSIEQLGSFFKMGIQSIPLIHAIKMRKAMRAMYLNLQTAATDSRLLAAKTLEPFFEKIHKKLRVGVVSYPFSNGLAFMI